MDRHSIKSSAWAGLLLATLITITATRSLAGGFWITVHSAELSDKGQRVVMVKAEGCHEPEKAVITAEAVSNASGRQTSMKLKLNPVSPGVYQIARQWTSEGPWVLAITSEYNGMISSVLVKLDAGGAIPAVLSETTKGAGQASVRTFRRKLTSDDIQQALAGVIGAQTAPEHGPTLIWQPLSAGAGLAGLALVGVIVRRRSSRKQVSLA